jgi:hypothetical protein
VKVHTLKIWQHWYDEVQAGRMTMQIRDTTDRVFQAGDQLELQAWDQTRGIYTPGRPPLFVNVIAVYNLPGLQIGYVAISITKVTP